jgi:hypothetical protein
MSATFVKANRNFACYVIIGILRMLYDFSCKHVSELQSLMSLCDASLLDDLPPELSKLMGCLIRRWWVEHGLPEAQNHLCREPEVIISSMSYCFCITCFDIRLTYVLLDSCCRWRVVVTRNICRRLRTKAMMRRMWAKAIKAPRCEMGVYLGFIRRSSFLKFKQCV